MISTPLSLNGVLILAGGLSTRMGSPKALLTLPNKQTLLEYHVQRADTLNVPIIIADNGQGFANSIVSNNIVSNDNLVYCVKDYHPVATSNAHVDTAKSNYSKHSAGPLGAILAGINQALVVQKEGSNEPLASYNSVNGAKGWLLVISCDSLIDAKQIWDCLSKTVLSKNIQNKDSHIHSSDDNSGYDNNSQNENDQIGKPDIYDKKVICFDSGEHLYPLLGLYRLDLANDLQQYLETGQRRVMSFITPFCLRVPLPKQWYMLSNLNTPQDFVKACRSVF